MTVRRLISIFSVCLVASVTAVAAQPKKQPAPKKAPAPAKDPAPAAPAPDAGSGSAAPAAPEEPPPKDIEGREENPGAPGGVAYVEPVKIIVPIKRRKASYPIEEALRPINLLANMSEVSIGPHAQLSPYAGSDALRARYGITRQVQLGLTYVLGGVFNDNDFNPMAKDKQAFHSGKAVGLDVTVMLQDWIGVRVGVPVYIKPVAVSLTLGAPIKFTLSRKFAIGGLDDLLNIKLKRFAPSFYQEAQNAANSFKDGVGTQLSDGELRISAFGVYNHMPKLAFIGRLGGTLQDFKTNKQSNGGLFYFLRAGLNYTPRKFIDLGFSIGFDDLSETGSFGPAGFLAFRI
ncbi:MAG: hypothetical protein ABI867_21265 [Kofleriaceae bacterium]